MIVNCKKCGENLMGTIVCKLCDRIRNRIYRKNNKEKERNRKRNSSNGYKTENSLRRQEINKKWMYKNLDKYNAKNARYRAAKLNRTPKWLTKEDYKTITHFYKKAQELTNNTGILHHVDHIVPLQGKLVSGLHVPWNLQVLPAKENMTKSNKI